LLLLIRPTTVVSSANLVGNVHGNAVRSEQGVQEAAEHAPLWGPLVEDQCGVGVVPYLHHLGSARHEV
jgi:hypothetical protein